MKSLKDEWEKNAIIDPYWSVLSLEKYKTSEISEENKKEFYQSGNGHIDYVIHELIKRFNYRIDDDAVALDIGCGVGRCMEGMTSHFSEIHGYDISEAMILIAKKYFDEKKDAIKQHIIRVSTNHEDVVSLKGKASFVHSVIVFQHIPIEDGYTLLQSTIDCIKMGGGGFIHIPVGKNYEQNDTCTKVFQSNGLEIKMHAYSLDRVLSVLEKSGIKNVSCDIFELDDCLNSVNIFMYKQIAGG